jgi:hypothetical protein
MPVLLINNAFKKELSLRAIAKQSHLLRDCFVAVLLAMTALIMHNKQTELVFLSLIVIDNNQKHEWHETMPFVME